MVDRIDDRELEVALLDVGGEPLARRQTQRGDMLAAVLKGASLEAFTLKLSDLPSASDEIGGMALQSDSDDIQPLAGVGQSGLIDTLLRMPLESGDE